MRARGGWAAPSLDLLAPLSAGHRRMVWMRGKPPVSSRPASDSVSLFKHVKAKPFGRATRGLDAFTTEVRHQTPAAKGKMRVL
jgi:hypothetical protein